MRSPRISPLLLLLTMVGAALACGPGVGRLQGETPQSGATPQVIEPTGLPTGAAQDFVVVAYLEPNFNLYDLSGKLLATRSAEGLSWARPNTAQVVGDAVYYVATGDVDQGEVVRRVTSTEATELDFTRTESFSGLTFAVSPDGERIAWSNTAWDGLAPVSQLWMAEIDGASPRLIAETDVTDNIPEYFVLEAVTWLADGDLVYAWQVTGIGGYLLFFGWSSLYRYDPDSGEVTPLAPVEADVSAPCWNDLTSDGAFALGACGGPAQVVERASATGVETLFPPLPDQGQAGAAAYAPSGERLAYAIARGDPEDEAGQIVLVRDRSSAPTPIASHAPGAFSAILWVDESRMVVDYWQGDGTFVDLVTLDGARSPIGAGNVIGLMLP